MSIFPPHARCYRAPHKQGAGADAPSYAEPSARSIAEQSDAGIKKKMRSEETASSKTEHRFDKFARRIAAGMLSAIRTSLSVFCSPDKDRWPAHRLLAYLKGAEALARDMLREIAAKLTLTPQPLRERRNVSAPPISKTRIYAACFRLGVNARTSNLPEGAAENTSPRHPGLRAAQDRDPLPLAAQPVAGGPPNKSADDEVSNFQSRLAALEDVLQHPGKHAARMARALYRAENGSGQRLTAQSPDDVLLESINGMIAAHETGDAETFAKLHAQWLDPG